MENQVYYWYYSVEDGFRIHLTVFTDSRTRQKVRCTFDIYKRIHGNPGEEGYVSRSLIATPWLARRVIEYALNHGWKPFQRLPLLSLGALDELATDEAVFLEHRDGNTIWGRDGTKVW